MLEAGALHGMRSLMLNVYSLPYLTSHIALCCCPYFCVEIPLLRVPVPMQTFCIILGHAINVFLSHVQFLLEDANTIIVVTEQYHGVLLYSIFRDGAKKNGGQYKHMASVCARNVSLVVSIVHGNVYQRDL